MAQMYQDQERITQQWLDQIAELRRQQDMAKQAGKRGEASSIGFKIRKMTDALNRLTSKGVVHP